LRICILHVCLSSSHLRQGLPSGLLSSGFPSSYALLTHLSRDLSPHSRTFDSENSQSWILCMDSEGIKSWGDGVLQLLNLYVLTNQRVYKSPPLVPILSQSTPSHPNSLRSILMLSSHLLLFPSGFPTKIAQAFHFSPMGATCPAHLTFLNYITLTISGEAYRWWSFWCVKYS
jgi:hypothetical protein